MSNTTMNKTTTKNLRDLLVEGATVKFGSNGKEDWI